MALQPTVHDLAEAKKGLLAIARERKALVAQTSLMDYIQFTSPDVENPLDPSFSTYEAMPHHQAVAHAVQTYVEGGFPGYDILILLMPPRHGKSEIVSRRLPAWYSGKYPRESIVVATYNDDFAADFGADVRKIMQTPQHRAVFPKHRLAKGGAAKDRLQTADGGMLMFVGRGGSLTGRGANLLIGDDLIKDDKEAASKAIRDAAWNWLTRVAMTRRMGKKLVILTFTRWHADDPIGRLIDPENENYSVEIAQRIKIITLPGIAEDDDPLGRKPGEALWPERFSADDLRKQRLLDPVGFSSLYQQRPTVEDGILFRRETIGYYGPGTVVGEAPEDLRIYCASDHAVTTGQRSDRTALLKVGIDRYNRIFLLDLWWQKAQTDVVVEAMLTMARTRGPLIWWAEKGHISKSIGPFLKKRMEETQTYFNVVEVAAIGDKEQRAQSIAARMSMGHVLFPKDAFWTEKAIDELLGFPNGLHDDFCLAGETRIRMAGGRHKRLDAVRVGDRVETPEGSRRVICAKETHPAAEVYGLTLSNGAEIVATGGHPFFVVGKGFVRVDALAYGDVVFDDRQDLEAWRKLKSRSTAGTDTGGTQTVGTRISEIISTLRSLVAGSCIGMFGRTKTALSLTVARFITTTTILATTRLRTSFACPSPSTARTTLVSGRPHRSIWPGSTLFGLWRQRGTGPTKGGLGTENMAKTPGQRAEPPAPRKPRASVAEPRSTRSSLVDASSATIPAVRVIGVEALTRRRPVYNLTVEGEHTFFAEGALTHNCDALAYIGLGLRAQVGASAPKVGKAPVYGTHAWMKEHQRKAERDKLALSFGGF